MFTGTNTNLARLGQSEVTLDEELGPHEEDEPDPHPFLDPRQV